MAALVWSLLAPRRWGVLFSYVLLVLAFIPWGNHLAYLQTIGSVNAPHYPCTARAYLQFVREAPPIAYGMFLAALLLLAREDSVRYLGVCFPLALGVYRWVDLGTRVRPCWPAEIGLDDNVAMVWFFMANALLFVVTALWELRRFWREDFPLWWRAL